MATSVSSRATEPSITSVDAFNIIERACSVFSLLGCVFIITTFCCSKAFHKPINRLVFYASFGNLMTNVATLMARTYIGDGNSAGCQFQAFLIQMFMPADAFWTLAMAVNVYLTFYFKFDAQRLRRMELSYLIACYGIPFVIALAYIFVSTPEKGRMYGNAVLWCWVAPSWDVFRIATFYGPVWIVILITFFIYIRAGREIYKKHKQLRNFSSHHEPDISVLEDPFTSMKTTEVYVTSETVDANAIDLAPLGRRGPETEASTERPQPAPAAYSVTISSNNRPLSHGGQDVSTLDNITVIEGANPPRPTTQANPLRRRAAYEANNATWSYTKCALLFFTAMLVTWIPSSANRVYSVVHTHDVSQVLEYMSAFVLPLQGFWNAVIYVVTSWKACKMVFSDLFSWRSRTKMPERLAGGFRADNSFQKMGSNPYTPRGDKTYESESVTELAASRPTTQERMDKGSS